MKEEQIDWTSFRKRIIIEKPMNELYNAWATKFNIESWFLEKADYYTSEDRIRRTDELFQKGDKYVWKWNNWDSAEEGEVLEANGVDSISFTFGNGGNVHIYLHKLDKGTEVLLIQDNIPTDEVSKLNFYVGCSTGWTFWLANLKAWLEHGITLNAVGIAQSDTKDLVNS